jgi:hypothetical protein
MRTCSGIYTEYSYLHVAGDLYGLLLPSCSGDLYGLLLHSCSGDLYGLLLHSCSGDLREYSYLHVAEIYTDYYSRYCSQSPYHLPSTGDQADRPRKSLRPYLQVRNE